MDNTEMIALAADVEDVLLRFHGHPEDAQTLRDVADKLYAAGDRDALVTQAGHDLIQRMKRP